jgi:hypothetical protein
MEPTQQPAGAFGGVFRGGQTVSQTPSGELATGAWRRFWER